MKRKFKLLKKIDGIKFGVGYEIEIDTTFIEYPEMDEHYNPIFNKIIKYDPATRPDLWEEIKEEKVNKTDTYKLIKCYPGSPKLGSVFSKREAYEAIFYLGKKQNSDEWQINLPIDIVENNPEFWQKVEEKSKTKFFKTEDGVDIFKDDRYFTVNQDYLIGGKIAGKESVDILNIFKAFSTKEKAEEYVYFAKPRFSFKDVEKAYNKMCEIPNILHPTKHHLISSLEKYCL